MSKRAYVIGGGTFAHVRSHLALAAPAFGQTARQLAEALRNQVLVTQFDVELVLTAMAGGRRDLVTNDDVSHLLDQLIADPETRVIVLSAALCDYDATVMDYERIPSGPHAERLLSRDAPHLLKLTNAEKLVAKIRKDRKDIFVVAFKTTTGKTADEQYAVALNALKRDSVNLVFANDTVTRLNMIVAPEETRYAETTDRDQALASLAAMIGARTQNTFTRSTVYPDPLLPSESSWSSRHVPESLRRVVDHCVSAGAYKSFRGVTAGHFAVKVDDGRILTSKRKTDHNKLYEHGLVALDYDGDDSVVAWGAKPSVGGQSQRTVFRDHPDLDCIVHFHCPLRDDAPEDVPVAEQWPYECGSHQCGQNTSSNLRHFPDFDCWAVMLDGHGPNVVFRKDADPRKITEFIGRNFDLRAKTGGLLEEVA